MKNENGKMKIEKMNRWQGLSKPRILLALLSCIFLAVGLLSCADENGLHDQNALMVTFEFKGFGENISGNYSIPGNFDGSESWDNTNTDVVLTKGEGTSEQIAVTAKNIQFSLCPVNEWTRPWYKAGEVEGNGSDAGEMRNFYIDDLDLDAGEITIEIDASSGTATPEVK